MRFWWGAMSGRPGKAVTVGGAAGEASTQGPLRGPQWAEIQPPPHLPRHDEYRAVLTRRKGLLPLMHTKVLEGSEGPAEASMGVWRKGR